MIPKSSGEIMKVYFITRFSIFDPTFRGFLLSRDNDPKKYKQRLFSNERLDQKFETFEKITFPSIIKQTHGDWKWLIYTSDQFPDIYMLRLRMLMKEYKNIEIILVKDFNDFFSKDLAYAYEEPFATVRIDDDDGLNHCFVQKIQEYSRNIGSIVSFTEGTLVKCIKGRVVFGEKISEKNCALGLTGIGVRIYNTGRHSDINTRYKVIYDSTPEMFHLNCSPFTDTNRGFTASERNLGKLKRLIFLIFHRPKQVPTAVATFFTKLFTQSDK